MPGFPATRAKRSSAMRLTLLLLLALSVVGCSRIPFYFRVPVIQGNIVNTDKVNQLEKGMTEPQVRYLLGTPLIDSTFGENRWDYVYYFRNARGQESESQLSLFFDNGKLARIEGNEGFEAQLPEEANEIDPDPTGI
jgi:outer membrane protein assembly factor BamE